MDNITGKEEPTTLEPELSIVVPAYNEEAVIETFHKRTTAVIDDLGIEAEVLYVNDGSSDATLKKLEALSAEDDRVTLLNLSRNFGKEIAMTAGLDHATGRAVVVIDADLQDPPELIKSFIEEWRKGYDVVYAQRISREGETALKKATAHVFYRVIQFFSGRVKIPEDTGDFRLMDRRAVDALLKLREHHRFMKGLFAWIGFRQKAISYHRDPRFAGETKWNYWNLWNFSLEGITSFTTAPLRIATYIGLLAATFSFCYGIFIVYKTLMYGDPIQGFPSLMTVITFLGGIQLLTLGIIGEYLGRIFNETKQRPLYLVERHKYARRYAK